MLLKRTACNNSHLNRDRLRVCIVISCIDFTEHASLSNYLAASQSMDNLHAMKLYQNKYSRIIYFYIVAWTASQRVDETSRRAVLSAKVKVTTVCAPMTTLFVPIPVIRKALLATLPNYEHKSEP